MHAAFRLAIALLTGALGAFSADAPSQAAPLSKVDWSSPAESRHFPTAAAIVPDSTAQPGAGELHGNVRVTFADGHSEMWTKRGRCLKPRVENGNVGWVRIVAANSQGEPARSVVRTWSPGGKFRDFPGGPAIEGWNFARCGSLVVIKSKGNQGGAGCALFDFETGKKLGEVKSTSVPQGKLYTALPWYAQPFADVPPPPAGTEADAVRKARAMIEGFRTGRLSEDHRFDNIQGPVIGGGPLIPVEPLRSCENMEDVAPSGFELAKLGVPVFPQAFALLDDEYAYMRYIGVVALNALTGLEPRWYYFWEPWDSNGSREPWAAQAKTEWLAWYTKKQADAEKPGK